MIQKILNLLREIKSKKRYNFFKLMKRYEYKSIKENEELQKELLFNILDYSIKNIPYYNNFLNGKKIEISKKTIFEDIKKFPILTKDILKQEFENLKNPNFKKRFFKNHSGGSTGEPTIFLQDYNYESSMVAGKQLFFEWAGRNEGERLIKLWGSDKDVIEGSQGLSGWINKHLQNIVLLNSFKMSEGDMKSYVNKINRYKPKVIEAYVQSIYELSKFVKKNNLKVYSPKGVITSAGTLYPEMRALIEEVFKTKVFNRYGSREAGDMACSCEKNKGLHLNILSHYIEILDKNLKPCKPGQIGDIYVTTLNNKVMPLIRYKIGDMAVPSKNKKCSCGRGMPLIEKVVGRSMEVFRTRDGKVIPGEFFIHFIGVVHNKDAISKFQVIQEDYDIIRIKAVIKNKKQFEMTKNEINSSILKVMGKDCKVIWDFVDDIPATKSGKYLYTISKVK